MGRLSGKVALVSGAASGLGAAQALACAQEGAKVVFGDIADPESKVSKIKAQDRNYRLLKYLNVNTRTSYLARIRNPNPKMPDAHLIGVASPVEEEHATKGEESPAH